MILAICLTGQHSLRTHPPSGDGTTAHGPHSLTRKRSPAIAMHRGHGVPATAPTQPTGLSPTPRALTGCTLFVQPCSPCQRSRKAWRRTDRKRCSRTAVQRNRCSLCFASILVTYRTVAAADALKRGRMRTTHARRCVELSRTRTVLQHRSLVVRHRCSRL